MRAIIKGVILGAVVAAGVSVLLAQTPTWTTPRTWATDDLLTAGQYNQQFRDNLLWLRADATLTGTAALDDLGCGTRGSGEVLYSDCDWAALPAGVVFDIHDDVTQAATIVDADRIPFSDESVNGDPMRYATRRELRQLLAGRGRAECQQDHERHPLCRPHPEPASEQAAGAACGDDRRARVQRHAECGYGPVWGLPVGILRWPDYDGGRPGHGRCVYDTASTFQTFGPSASLSCYGVDKRSQSMCLDRSSGYFRHDANFECITLRLIRHCLRVSFTNSSGRIFTAI